MIHDARDQVGHQKATTLVTYLRRPLHEDVKGVTDARISMYPRDRVVVETARPASVGAMVGAKPELSVVLSWSHQEFDRVWALAMARHLKFTHLYFTKPHYNSAWCSAPRFQTSRRNDEVAI